MASKTILKFFSLGLLLRLLIMPFTGHWDLTSLNQVADNLFNLGKATAYQHYFAIYPPLTYILLGLWQKIISPFTFFDLSNFLSDPNIISFLNPHVFRYLFLLKFPYLFFDLVIGFILADFFKGSQKEKIFKLWMLNPITLYAVFAWGAIDIIPTFFSILALYLARKNHGLLGGLLLGIGASFKAFPFLLLLPLCLICFSTQKARIKAFIFGLMPFLITILPFIADKSFISRFFSSDQLQVIQHASFYIGREQNISIFYIFYIILLIFLYRNKLSVKYLTWIFFLILFLFYALSAFTPQWFVWGLPFFFLILADNNLSVKWYYSILLIYFLLVILFEVTLNLGLLAPVDNSFLEYPSTGELVSRFFNVDRLNGILRSILAGEFFYLIYLTRPKQPYVNS